MIVYLDVLFLINFFVNYVVLIIVSSFGSIYTKKYRIFLAGLLGAIYAVFMFFEPLHFAYSLFFKLAISVLMCFVAYGKKYILKSTIMLFTVSFFIAGATLAVFYITKNPNFLAQNSIFYIDISVNILISACIICYLILGGVLKGIGKNKIFESKTAKITICILGEIITLCAFLDSGNILYDNLTGKPVIIVDPNALPQKYKFLANDPVAVISLNDTLLKLRLINYKTLKKEEGMMIIFTPEYIKDEKDKKIDALIGISSINIAGCTAIMGV